MQRQLARGRGVDFVSQFRNELDQQLNGGALAPHASSSLAPRGRPDFAQLTRANVRVEIPRSTRMTRFRKQRIERFPDGRVVDERWEACYEETTELFTAQGSLFRLSGDSLLDRLLGS